MTSRTNMITKEPVFVLGVFNAEDLAEIPDTRWLVASSMPSPSRKEGCLCLIDRSTRSSIVATIEAGDRLPSPFSPHGIALRPGEDGRHVLYVVHHDSRESVEVFDIDATIPVPQLRWSHSLLLPPHCWANDIVPLPDGGLIVTNMVDPDDPNVSAKMIAGQTTGAVLEWHEASGWQVMPGTAMCGPNSIALSPTSSGSSSRAGRRRRWSGFPGTARRHRAQFRPAILPII
jgi:hypothetical protein